jgi:hypothetical protein
MADVWIKNDDTAPVVRATLTDGQGTPADLNGATVRFIMRPIRDSMVVVSAAADNDQNGTGTDGTLGYVSYTWQAGDTTEPGGYYAEFEVTYAGGEIETFPNDGYLTVAILDDLETVGS